MTSEILESYRKMFDHSHHDKRYIVDQNGKCHGYIEKRLSNKVYIVQEHDGIYSVQQILEVDELCDGVLFKGDYNNNTKIPDGCILSSTPKPLYTFKN